MNRSVLSNNKKVESADFFAQKERYTFDINRNFKPPTQESRPYLNRNNSAAGMSYVQNLKQQREKSSTPQFE